MLACFNIKISLIIFFIGCGKGFVCIATSDPNFKNYFLTTQSEYMNYFYYPTTDHTFPLLLENASIEELPTRPEFKWKFKCLNCTSMTKCQVLLLQKRYEFYRFIIGMHTYYYL